MITRRGNYFCLAVIALILAIPPPFSRASDAPQASAQQSSQQKRMEENFQDSIPDSDLDDQQKLENPRIVVPENLDEMPDVDVVSAEDSTGEKSSNKQDGVENLQRTGEELKEIEDELDLEAADRGLVLLDKTDRLLEISRLPLTYVEEHVPFLTRRNIIFFGRLEVDVARFSSGVLADDNGFDLRRLRLGLAGNVRFWEGWNYKLEFDLTDSENTLSDAYLSWRSQKWGTFRIGNQRVAQTLSGQTSSLSIPFMERPLPVLAFTLQRRLGVGWDTHLKKVGANITVFGWDPNKGVGSQGWAARAYFNPVREKFHVIHVGASFMQLSSDDDARMWARPESYVTSIRLVDTGVEPDVDTSSAAGLELAGSRGPVTLRSEFYRTEWSRSDNSNPKFKGWYAEASWFLTGEKAHYRAGKFIRPNIERDRGAWELAARFSTINLNDEDIVGGTEKNLSFGVNWYSRTHWRFMGNLIKVNAKDGPYGEQKPWIIQFRAQYYF
jgi:phosphate-selective porin OprO/OprP